MHPCLNIAIKACRIVGKSLINTMLHMQIAANNKSLTTCYNFTEQLKNNLTNVVADLIVKSYPAHNIKTKNFNYSNDSEITWLIDPLNGELNFCYGIPLFAVSIAILNGKNIEHGVIYNPVSDELFFASKGNGAKLNNQKIRVNNNHKLEEALLSLNYKKDKNNQLDVHWYHKNITNRQLGSSALQLVFVASNRLDGYCDNDLYIPEIAAGALIVKEAGGYVSVFDHKEEDFWYVNNIIAANPKIYSEIAKSINC